ncbi:hypothetical protein D1J36_007425 [Riemerella anatipestifer]|uniref:hypothetical protein n=1 Tax=Riemerella anatipestifer TaxID=34085 RepID=UPI0012AE7354|nr:hypothetical protein [Riemerella anatipestifer]USL95110.1 hypothetical protein D1J36_007425 [Riemerella anatipestifer]
MKKILLRICMILICLKSFAQSNNQEKPVVIYKNEISTPLFEMNGELYPSLVLSTLKNLDIESININKGSFELDGKSYTGKIIIKTKSKFNSNLITVKQLVSKYTNLKDSDNYIYSVNKEIINSDADSTFINEKNITQITVYQLDKINSLKNMNFIKIFTKTDKKSSKENNFIIRGNEP